MTAYVGPAGLGLLRTATGVGATVTSVALVIAPIERHVQRRMFAGVALFGVSTVVFGLSRSFTLSLVELASLGVGYMVSVYVCGRARTVGSMFVGASNELGALQYGITGGWLGLVPAVVLGGAVTLA